MSLGTAPLGVGPLGGGELRPIALALSAVAPEQLEELRPPPEAISDEGAAVAYLVERGWRPPKAKREKATDAITLVLAVLQVIDWITLHGPAGVDEVLHLLRQAIG